MWQAEKFGIIKYDSSTDFLDITECEGYQTRLSKDREFVVFQLLHFYFEAYRYSAFPDSSVEILLFGQVRWGGMEHGLGSSLSTWALMVGLKKNISTGPGKRGFYFCFVSFYAWET